MTDNFEFKLTQEGNIITKYLGNDFIVKIPREILGNKVIAVENSAFRDKDFIMEIILPQGLETIGDYAFCGCKAITKIDFPESIKAIGSHSFYNCRGLEEITMGSNLEYIGDGFIKNCEKIKIINIDTVSKLSPAIVTFFNELKEEFLLNVKDIKAKIIFPQYDYDFFVNAPARVCTTVTVGAGVKYRQSLSSKGINIAEYDGAFSKACVEEKTETLLCMAFERLKVPFGLNKENRQKYILYIENNIEASIELASKNTDIKILEVMQENNIFTNINIDNGVEAAAKAGNSEVSAFMLDLKFSKYNKKIKTFDL